MRGYAPEAVAALVTELTDERALDDARYAANYVAFHSARGQGPFRIAADLKALGVPEALVDVALESGPDWPQRAREVRSRRFGRVLPRSRPELARQARFLQYRGFSSDHIRSALGPHFEPDE